MTVHFSTTQKQLLKTNMDANLFISDVELQLILIDAISNSVAPLNVNQLYADLPGMVRRFIRSRRLQGK